ncbi:MAG: hypothetical protein QY322_02980 [bacterium]|nr:MAG: hypothetical protein QY322_02980 [bacterium]
MRNCFNKLDESVILELAKAKKYYELAKISAQEIAQTALTSHSQAGDRFHSQGTAELTRQKYETILSLKKEIDLKGEKIVFNYNNETVYIVDNPIMLSGFKIISSMSPLGEKILNEK